MHFSHRCIGLTLSIFLGFSSGVFSESTGPLPLDSPQVLLKVPFFSDTTDQCGPATLAELLTFWGKPIEPQQLRQEMYLAKLRGTLPMDLLWTAQTHGLKSEMTRGDLAMLQAELSAGRPVLAMLNLGYSILPVNHYVVVTGFDKKRQGVFAHSSNKPNQFFSYKKFLRAWNKADNWAMLADLPETS